MTTKEKIIRQTVVRIDKRLSQIKELIDARPIATIIELRIKAQAFSEKHKDDYAKIAEAVKPLAKEEKRQHAIFKKQEGTQLWDERLRLETEKHDLANELFFLMKRR